MSSTKPLYLQGQSRGRGRGTVEIIDHRKWNTSKPGTKSATQRFEDVSAVHHQQVQKYLSSQPSYDESDDEDDKQNDEEILKLLIEKFSGQVDNRQFDENSESLGRTEEYLVNSMKSESTICLICIDSIKKIDPIWSCHGCYCMFHINCIQKWVRDGVYQKTALSDEHFPQKEVHWFCPKCRHKYKQSDSPKRYTCFCGKQEDPEFDPWLVPHSCGQVCGHHLKPDCGHSCLLLCHPGPCPPCPKTVRVKCYCGNSPATVRRCGMRVWSCGSPCSKYLACGHHRCLLPCHEGECPGCEKTSLQPCACGKQTITQPCAVPNWQCVTVCGQLLQCGHHRCETVCHSGPCGDCPRAGDRSCPCGKTNYELPCTEDVPTCLDTCSKTLKCGLHQCTELCHYGPCGMCRHVILKTCRCGAKKKEMPCFKDYLCETKCTQMKDCGKHQCKRKCCDGNCPPCELPCSKRLRCRNHKCESPCHTGPCYPCPRTIDKKCNCGSTKIAVPCGRETNTKPPRCNMACRTPPDCHHPQRLKHRCHFGRCPPCHQMCCKQLAVCTHTCPAVCHTAVFTRQQEKVERVGPWEPKPEVKFGFVDYPCPPCQVLVPATCLGKHEMIKVACHKLKPYSCGRQCNRLLLCENHTCFLQCHNVIEARDDQSAGSNCAVCEEPCSKSRAADCKHGCHIPCHPGECPPCTQMIRMRCHCLVTLLHIDCNKWSHADDSERTRLKSCPSQCPQLLSCGHQCTLQCHTSACVNPDQCKERTKVKCPCKRKSRNFPCHEARSGLSKLECDDVCKENKKQEEKRAEESQKQRKDKELEKQKKEFEEYNRKMQVRKRKPRKLKEDQEAPSLWERYGKYVVFISLVIVVISIAWANLTN